MERILFKTRNSGFWNNPEAGFRTDFTYLEPDGARRLTEMNIKLVGIDYLSVERFKSENFETHTILLSDEVVILEGLDLRNVPAGRYELLCLPLRIAGGNGDGAPARAILRALASSYQCPGRLLNGKNCAALGQTTTHAGSGRCRIQ